MSNPQEILAKKLREFDALLYAQRRNIPDDAEDMQLNIDEAAVHIMKALKALERK